MSDGVDEAEDTGAPAKVPTGLRPAIKRIVRDLQDPDEDIATYASMNVLRLREVNPDEIRAVSPVLRDATTHDSISVRFFAKKALNALRHQMAKYPEFRVELDALRAETMGTSWIDLLANLEDAETEKKLVVLDLLRDVQDPSLASATLDFMQREGDPFVLAEAVKVVGAVGDERNLPGLEPYLSHSDSRVRSNTAEALEEIGGKQVMLAILPLLDDEDNRVKGTVAKLLGKYGEHNVLHALSDMIHSVELWMRESATYALGFVPFRESEDLLFEALLDVNPEVQAKAIYSLQLLRSRSAREYLETVVRQADPKLGEMASIALGKINQDPQDYPYFDEANRYSDTPLAQRLQAHRKSKKDDEPAPGEPGEGEEGAEGEVVEKPQGFFARMRAKREDDKLKEMLKEERLGLDNELFLKRSELGRLALDIWRGGELADLEFLKVLNNDVKKILYLIDLKESQKKEIEEEASRSSFLGFLRESLLRFSSEKRVESRVSSLQTRLMKKYAEVGDRVLGHFPIDAVELMQFKDLPLEIVKLRRRLGEVDKAAGVAPAGASAEAAEAPAEAAPEGAEGGAEAGDGDEGPAS